MAKKYADILLYSTCTELAYKVNKRYYNDIHFVWCTDSFDAALQPGTSNPRTMCTRYLDQIIKNDKHAVEIYNNKAGILKGAKEKYSQGVINEEQYAEIKARVAFAEMTEFYPVIYLIDKRSVKSKLEVVDKEDAASDSSVEYIIRDLKSNEFEVIRIKDVLAGVVHPVDDL